MSGGLARARRGLVVCIAGSTGTLSAQVVHESYVDVPGVLRIGPGEREVVSLTERGYTLVLPDTLAPPAGLVVMFDARRPDLSTPPDAGSLDHEALARRVGLLRLTTGNPLDFLFEDAAVADVATRLQDVLERHRLEAVPLFFAGLSLGGTRALRLAGYLMRQGDDYWVRPAAVAVADAPLDMVRLWEAERRAARDDFHPAAAGEGRWVTHLLERHLGGTPVERFGAYRAYSPFVYLAPDGGNAVHLGTLRLRAYHEPDVDWWIEHRRKSYYSMNSIDLAALVNQLRLLGNNRAQLVTTNGARAGAPATSPHTWSMVDNADLVEWFLVSSPGAS